MLVADVVIVVVVVVVVVVSVVLLMLLSIRDVFVSVFADVFVSLIDV